MSTRGELFQMYLFSIGTNNEPGLHIPSLRPPPQRWPTFVESIVGDGEAVAVAVAVAAAYTPYTPYTHYTHYTP